MNRVFGKSKTQAPKKKSSGPAPSLSDASKGMDARGQAIDVKIAELDKELIVYRDKMKKCRNPNTKRNLQRRAMETLKRKRMYEGQREALANQQFNIDQAAFGVESAKATVSTVAALKSASNELKSTMQNDLNIDEMEDVVDDMAELMYDFEEMNDILGRSFATPEYIDETELDAELDMLGDELENDIIEEDATPSYLQPSALPSIPTASPGGKVPAKPNAQVNYS